MQEYHESSDHKFTVK